MPTFSMSRPRRTGDTLLIGATGRTDLPTGDAESEYRSLQRLLSLSGDTLVFPAHDYGGRTFSTLGHERLTNPRPLEAHDEPAEQVPVL
ncbi:MAG: hypothetical protein ACXU86_16510 [Archangium sp.]